MKMKRVVLLSLAVGLSVSLAGSGQNTEAPTGFDNQTNGLVDQPTHAADQSKFEEVEGVKDGVGPLYNAQSCRECHQNPTSGGASQTTEIRVGHRDRNGPFQNPSIPINDGKVVITGRTLVNDRAICPSGDFPDIQLQEHVPASANVRAARLSLNLLGDGFVEAVPDPALRALARDQCRASRGRICGQVILVPVLEAPGKTGLGRFGWKDQQASLLSFAGDAYLNEMGITNKLFPDEITPLCNTVSEPNDTPGPDGLEDIDHFARFIRATKAPPRDAALAATPEAQEGERLFHRIGCDTCHVPTLVTAPADTMTDGGTFTIPAALGQKQFHPYGDFLLHDVGTGDGIPVAMEEHYGPRAMKQTWKDFSYQDFQAAARKVRTAPLWGVRIRSRLMHDGGSLTLEDAIRRHKGEAARTSARFRRLTPAEQQALLAFLRSL